MIRYVLILVITSLWIGVPAYGQGERKLIRQGNQLYQEEKYDEAEIQYRRALEGQSRDQRALFNLGNSLYRQGRYQEAAEIFQALAQTASEDQDKASAWHNLGNSYLNSQKVKESIDAYKNALRLKPQSDDTRHNLAYAMQVLQDPPPEEQNQEGDDQGEDEQQQEPQADDPQQPEQEKEAPQPRPDQLTAQDAERILDALNQQEQKVQEDLKKKEGKRVPARVEREW